MIIHPGEYFSTAEDIIISTVLGSCVAVALWDSESGIAGLNHFMLPHLLRKDDTFLYPSAKYGIYAMELLINDLMKQGANRLRLKAKVFGGGSVLAIKPGRQGSIPDSNVEFAMLFLKKEGIPVISSDTGGNDARKIFFFVKSAKVLLKRFGGAVRRQIELEEQSYGEKIKKKEPEGTITLF